MGRPTSKVSKVVVPGPLKPFAAAFKSRLEELGYMALTTVNVMRLMAHLSCWLDTGGMTVVDLMRVEQYIRERRAAERTGSSSPRSLEALLELLGSLDVLPADQPAPPCSASEVLLTSFRGYVLEERALAPSTTAAYVDRARRLLAGHGEPSGCAEPVRPVDGCHLLGQASPRDRQLRGERLRAGGVEVGDERRRSHEPSSVSLLTEVHAEALPYVA